MTNKIAAITFDDGPTLYSKEYVKVLKKYNVPATFFVLGKVAMMNAELLRIIDSEGHAIGNHTWNHIDITGITDDELEDEIVKTNEAILKITGKTPKFFRPPYGLMNERNYLKIKELGMQSVLWNVDSTDWDTTNPVPIPERVKFHLREQSIILFHDLHDGLPDGGDPPIDVAISSFEETIHLLLEREYSIVSLSEFFEKAFPIEKPIPGYHYIPENN